MAEADPAPAPAPAAPAGERLPVVTDHIIDADLLAAEARAGGSGYAIKTTMPDELLRHDISDEELDKLGDNQRGLFHEFMWASLTGAFGSAWGVFEALHGAFFVSPRTPLSGYAVWELTIFVVFAALAMFSGVLVVRESTKGGSTLKDQIRTRTRSRKERAG